MVSRSFAVRSVISFTWAFQTTRHQPTKGVSRTRSTLTWLLDQITSSLEGVQ